jgi:hypothetical protein
VESEVSLYWSTVTPEQRRLVEVTSPYAKKWRGYLAGGTAVALRLGHRRSVDLDFFTKGKLDADALAADIRRIAKAARMGYELEDGNKKGSFGAKVGRVSISVLHGYSQTDEPDVFDSCPIAALGDLATMKVFAIGGRSEKKDFVDLHEIVMTGMFSIGELMGLFAKKFRRRLTPKRLRHFRRSLTDFSLAEPTLMPKMLKTQGRSWPVIKRHLKQWASD